MKVFTTMVTRFWVLFLVVSFLGCSTVEFIAEPRHNCSKVELDFENLDHEKNYNDTGDRFATSCMW